MDRLYAFAAEVYKKNLSTTKRPFYIARPRFLFIHLVDPHLMCIPSLHVMVVVFTYTKFASILRSLDKDRDYTAQTEEMKRGALIITQAILYVKQHSVSCIATALYAMTRFDNKLFPPEEAEAFAASLFSETVHKNASACISRPPNYRVHPSAVPGTKLAASDTADIKAHIISLYRRFLEEGKTDQSWEEPLLRFMRELPACGACP
jgi:hypothetical protein